eukprot:12729945-Ditylum_brightwellii.AAC.2
MEELKSKPSFSSSNFHWHGIPSSKVSTNFSWEILVAVMPSGTGKFTKQSFTLIIHKIHSQDLNLKDVWML